MALLERRGRFLIAAPLFEDGRPPGRRLAVQTHGIRAADGDIALVRVGRRGQRERASSGSSAGRTSRATSCRRCSSTSGWATASPTPSMAMPGTRRARARTTPRPGATCATSRHSRSIPRDAQDFDDAISAAPHRRRALSASGFTSPTSRPSCAPARRSTWRPAAARTRCTCPARSSRCCRTSSRAAPARCAPGEDRFAVTAELELDEHGACASRQLLSLADPLRHPPGLRSRTAHPRRLGAPRRSLGPSRWRCAPRCRRAPGRRRRAGALAIDSPEPEFAFDADGLVTAAAMREQSESHRLIEQLMIAANEAVADLLENRSLPCLYRVHERPEPAAVERLVEQLASLDVPPRRFRIRCRRRRPASSSGRSRSRSRATPSASVTAPAPSAACSSGP